MLSKTFSVLAFSAGIVAMLPASSRGQSSPADGAGPQEAWTWTTASPESQGMRTDGLDALWAGLQQHKTDGLLVIRNDRVVYERYAPNYSRTTIHYTASMAKAVVGSTTLMLAMDDGLISPDDKASKFVSSWAGVPLKRDITIRELATHTSGLADAEDDALPLRANSAHAVLKGWKGDFWKYPKGNGNPFTIARDLAPVTFTPGTSWHYSNPGIAILTYCVTASVRGQPQADTRLLMKHRVMDPIGVPANEWDMGYGTTTLVDGLPLVAVWGGAGFSPNATARLARLMLHKGDWDGKRLISEASVYKATHYSGTPNNAGLSWWVNHNPDGRRVWPALPEDAYYGEGAGDQFVLIVPSLNLILVRNGNFLTDDFNYKVNVAKYIVDPLMSAFASPPPPSVFTSPIPEDPSAAK